VQQVHIAGVLLADAGVRGLPHPRRLVLVAEQEAARQAVAGMPLGAIFVNPRWGEMSLRWALIHMIGEYAGHTGQADLIRERIDGKAGWW